MVSRVGMGSRVSQLARLQGCATRHHQMRGEVTAATIGGMDPCKFYSFLVFPKNVNKQGLSSSEAVQVIKTVYLHI